MTLRAFISTNDTEACRNYLQVAKAALFNIDDFPMSAITAEDVPGGARNVNEVAKKLIASADVFVGIYGATYGSVAPGNTQSDAELQYQYATSLDKMCLLFVESAAWTNADERQQAFFRYIEQHHVLTRFKSGDDLSAKVKLALVTYKENASMMGRPLTQLAQNLRPRSNDLEREVLPSAPPQNELEAWITQALSVAEPAIEQIVRRALELHDAQTQVQSIQAAIEELDGIIEMRPIFGEPLRRSQFEADIFMIMPFRERFDNIYTNVIRPTATRLNLTIKRGDDFASARGAVMQDVWAAINAARLVIVETTEVNANVYYELGIAHTLGKPAILLTQNGNIDDVPFDIRHLRFTIYNDSIAGARKLERDLRQAIIWLLNDLAERDEQDAL